MPDTDNDNGRGQLEDHTGNALAEYDDLTADRVCRRLKNTKAVPNTLPARSEKPSWPARFAGKDGATLEDVIAHLKKVYAGDVGIEYTYITNKKRCGWIEQEFEQMQTQQFSLDQKKRILFKLNEGVIFEKFLHTKYIGQKRFSLEGGESTIPALDTIINEAAAAGVQEVTIGMAHRGRLNILANTLGKTYEQIFSEFEGNMPADTTMGSGDVKYHLGFRSNIKTPSGIDINVQLTPNPSHLEVVDPVVTGFARAKADVLYDHEYDSVLPILIHGDAAIAGQGVVYELLQMSKLEGYSTGGTIHFVINNQIGFTTDFDDARSSDYCTSIASLVHAPVLHVNGDDPEAVVKAAMLAVKYRQEFNQDIFIDMVCYRRHGHNEGDDPSFTQPKMYELIKAHPNPREVYNKQLIERGDVDAELAKEMEAAFWKNLQERLDDIKQKPIPYQLQGPEQAWQKLSRAKPEDFLQSPETGIGKEQVEKLFRGLMQIPEGFKPLRKIQKLLEEKEAFITVFRKLGQFRNEGSLEGWIRRIVINTSLNGIKARYPVTEPLEDLPPESFTEQVVAPQTGNEQDLISLVRTLPDGYRTVFNLYAVEGYSHEEIGQLLGIKATSSRSQYARARELLMKKLGADYPDNKKKGQHG
ncbi:2-oxoglutarate decarboxylase domain protein [Ostertagia ostertagi]